MIDALRTGRLISTTIGAAVGLSPRGFSIAGSVSLNLVDGTTQAILRDAATTLTGGATLSAVDNATIIAIGGALGFGGSVGVGAGLALNEITKHTEALVESTKTARLSFTAPGGLSITASNDSEILAVALSVGVGQSAIAFTIAINLITDSYAKAWLKKTSLTASGGDVSLTATDASRIYSGVGSVALSKVANSVTPAGEGPPPPGATNLAFGVSVAVNIIRQDTTALIDDSIVNASGGAVQLLSTTSGTIFSVAVSGGGSLSTSGGSGFKFAGAGVVTYNEVAGDVVAQVNASTVTSGSGKEIGIRATDASVITADAGAVALSIVTGSTGGFNGSAGAAIAINKVDKDLHASSDSSSLTSGGAVAIVAASVAAISVFALGIAGAVTAGSGGGAAFAGAGSGAGSTVGNETLATITGGSVTATGNLNVSATDSTTIHADAGGVAMVGARGPPGALAVGISVATNEVTNVVRAQIDGSATISAADVDLSASTAGPDIPNLTGITATQLDDVADQGCRRPGYHAAPTKRRPTGTPAPATTASSQLCS